MKTEEKKTKKSIKKKVRKCIVLGCKHTDKDEYVQMHDTMDLCLPCYEALIGKNTAPSAVRSLFLQRRGVAFSEVHNGERFYTHNRDLLMKMPPVAIETEGGNLRGTKKCNAVVLEARTGSKFNNGEVVKVPTYMYCEITRMEDVEKATIDNQ